MLVRSLLFVALLSTISAAQTLCPPTPAYSICDIVFELNQAEAASHPNPYLTVDIRAELRSPRHRTSAASAFWDGANRMVIRFAPIEDGAWDFRITSNISRFQGKQGQITATASEHPGFLKPANGHHWMTSENRQPHLWMGATRHDFAWMDAAGFQQWLEARAAQKFNHVRGYAISAGQPSSWQTPDKPDIAFHKTLDDRLSQINGKGMVADLILGHGQDHLRRAFPSAPQRERYIRYLVSRYSAYNITWQLVDGFEEYTDARELMKQLGTLLKTVDPYGHPRTTDALITATPLLADGWMDHILSRSSSDDLGAIEHQIHPVPFVNTGLGLESASAGDPLRVRLWNAAMNGQYPLVAVKDLDEASAKAFTVWQEFFASTRYWELEPYFDLDGGRAVALPGVEYIVYVEKPSGPIEVRLERHGYDVKWVDPATGETILAKDFKSERQSFDPPSAGHDWILHISREGRKEGMLRSYKFESRPFLMQEVETGLTKIPYEIAQPAKDELSLKVPARYEVKLKRETRGTRSMMFLWTAEAPSNGQGFRILGAGVQGTFRYDKALLANSPAVLNLRLYGLNANGKLYALDRIFRVSQ